MMRAVQRAEPATRWSAVAPALLLAACVGGCSWLSKPATKTLNAATALFPGDNPADGIDPVELQEDLLRFADNLSGAALTAAEQLRKDGKAIDRADLLQIRIYLGWDILTSATGANALGNLVDLLLLTSAGRIRLEDYWMPKVYGSSALAMLEAFRTREATIWALAKDVFKPEQCTELRDALEAWRRERGGKASALPIYASLSLIDEVTKAVRRRKESVTSSVFALLDIDPLAGLDPATRELAQTRLFAERALYVGERMPQFLQWQAELLALQTARIPEVRQLVANSTQLATSGDRLTRTLEQTPALIGAERERILAALQSQEGQLRLLSRDLAATLAQGTKMADAVNGALKTFHAIADGFKEDPSQPKEASEPFRIKDYAETAAEIAKMSQQLQQLLAALQPTVSPENFAKLSAQAEALTARTEARGMALVNHAYRMALQWVGLSTALVLAAALTYRYASTRITRAATRPAG